jgi:hypothetical protein
MTTMASTDGGCVGSTADAAEGLAASETATSAALTRRSFIRTFHSLVRLAPAARVRILPLTDYQGAAP